jgi:2-keto-4-pentenoate hydratase
MKSQCFAIVAGSRVAAGLELPSARYRDWFGRTPVPDLVSDNTAVGRLVVGTAWVAAANLDLAAVGMRLRHDGVVVQSGVSSAVLSSPALALAWLSEALARRRHSLRQGDLVSSGTFGIPLPIQSGRWEAEFDGVGTVSAVFG